MTNSSKDQAFSPMLVAAVREHPDDFTAWDELESAAAEEQTPEPVAELYAETLARDFPLATAKRIGERALRFCEEWFADETELMQTVLLRVFELDPGDEAIFDRLSMGLTAAGAWDKLLSIYERAVDASDSVERQIQLLEDAVRVAKDLALDSERAIAFMTRLVPLRPHDQTLRAGLEKLLERAERFRELIALWDSGILGGAPEEVARVQVQIASCWLHKLRNAPAAVEVLGKVLEENPADADALALLEVILGSEDAAPGTRRDALNLLRTAFTREKRPLDVARVIRASLAFAHGEEREALYREAVGLWLANDAGAEALKDLGELFVLLPDDAQLATEVAELAARLGEDARCVDFFERAAAKAQTARRAGELYLRAATLAHHPVGDVARAIGLCERVFAQDADADLALDAGRALDALLEAKNAHEARLPVLERLTKLESDAERRREVRGALARLAHAQGQRQRAIATWHSRIEEDAQDREALDGLVALHEEAGDYRALVEVLTQRVALAQGEEAAADLARIAQIHAESLNEIEAALAAWSEVHRVAPDKLLTLSVRELLDRAASGEEQRGARVLSLLGDAYRVLFGDAERALSYYKRALGSEVASDSAQAGLVSLLEVPEVEARAADALAGAYALADNHEGLLSLLPHRLSGATDVAERARLLRQAAQLEERREQAEPAFQYLCAALQEAPEESGSDAELLRLAEQLEGFETLADSLHAASDQLDAQSPRMAQLVSIEGSLAERFLSDRARALAAYVKAFRAAPEEAKHARAVVRVGAQQGEFELVVDVLLSVAQRGDEVPEDLVSLAEAEVTDATGYAALAAAAEAGIEASRLNPPVKRELLLRIAAWREKQCSDLAGAETLLQKAFSLGAPHAETLRRLIAIQRGTPGAQLFESLMALAQLTEHEFDTLVEAHALARDTLQDVEAERRVLGSLMRRSALFLLQGTREVNGQSVEKLLIAATSRLADLLDAAGDRKAELLVLRETAQLPLEPQHARFLSERAARLSSEHLGDHALAATLYQRALEHAPEATELLAALADEVEKLGRLEELLVLRRKELQLTTSLPRKLELRLDVARVMAEMETRGGRLGALRDNLREAPGHAASLSSLEQALRERGALSDVHALFAEQAAQLEGLGDRARAAELWLSAAKLSDQELHDEEKALSAYQRVCDLSGSNEALDALARIRTERGEYAAAIPWLVRRLETLAGEERAAARLNLARAYELSSDPARAIECLVSGLQEAPQAAELREQLVRLYRETGRELELAQLLAESALESTDPARTLSYAREAAELFCGKLAQPERAVAVLSRAVEMEAEDDRSLKCLYADALLAANRLDEAKAVLDGMIQAFGRRRSVERAEVHMRLSKVAQASSNIEEALEQLETASSMDRSHPGILRALGDLAFQAGQLDRAERAYRALLMALKKVQPDVDPGVGVAEVLYELHRIAKQLNQVEKAEELLESAVQTAVHSEAETLRLKQLLVGSGDSALLLRVLEMRLSQVTDNAAEAAARSDLADVLELSPERKSQALDERLRAVACVPERDALHKKALALAESLGAVERYAESLRSLYDRARRKEDAALSNELALRAAAVYEHNLGDLSEASERYRAVQAGAPGYVEAQFALARVAGKLGKADDEREVLAQIAALPDEPAFVAGKREARYRVAELTITDASTREEGIELLNKLLEDTPDYARAGAILRAVSEAVPEDQRVLELLEQIARRSDDPALLLYFLERHVGGAEPSLARIREGAELAQRIGNLERAEWFMRRALQVAEQNDGIADALWAAVALGRLRAQAGDIDGAVDWLERAMHATDSYEGFELGLEAAKLAEERGKDAGRTIRIYESLRERDPTDKRVWSALLGLYQQKGEFDRAQQLVSATLESLIDPAERNVLRVETARFLFESGREDEGARFLLDVLAEDPDHEEATIRLADLYQRRGQNEAMAELLSRKLESARERRSPSLIPLSLRMGSLLEETRPDAAVEVYKEGLALLPDSYELMRATLSLLDPESEAAERAALLERYLLGDGRHDENALNAALWLLEYHTQGGDEAAFERALGIAYHVAPGHDEIRSRLEQWYRQRGDFSNLVQLLEQEAERAQEQDSARALELISEAAEIRLHQMGQPSEAAALLRRARALVPNDLALLKRAVLASAAAGDVTAALEEVESALSESGRKKRERVELLTLSAEVATAAGQFDDALEALDSANLLAGGELMSQVLSVLEQARADAQARSDVARERQLTLRLAESLNQAGDAQQASDLLLDWVSRTPNDVEALRTLLGLLGEAGRWSQAVGVAEALLSADELEHVGAIGERLLAAARALGDLGLARNGLEAALLRSGEQPQLVELLAELYEELGEKAQLADLLLRHLSPSAPADKRFEQLRRVGQLLLDAGDSERALWALTLASELRPDDTATVLFIADAQIGARRFQEAQDLLEKAMNACKQRRSPELAQLRYRMARLSAAAGDPQARLEWLNTALDADMNNGEIASELAVVAQHMGDLDTALKALRAITMLKSEAPMTRAEAFYRQAVIVAQKGEPRRAVLWAKKAKAENANFPGVDELLAELGEAS